jgi:hypothetical protein
MFKNLALALILLAGIGRAAVPSVSLPLDWTGAAGISRANLNLNPIALRDGLNVAIDSLNPVLAAISGWNASLALASTQDLILKVDSDANGTHKLVVTANNADSILRIHEDGTARLFDHLAVDSNLTVRKVTAADSLLGPSLTLSGLTASRLLATNAGKTAASVSDLTSWVAGTANQITSTSDGDGTLTLSLPSAVTFPGSVIFGTNASGAAGAIWKSSTTGLTLEGATGSGYDFAILNPSAQAIFRNPTGTQTVEFPGAATMAGITSSADISVSKSTAGATSIVSAVQSDNTNTASSSRVQVTVGGASGGDPYTRYTITGATDWATGPDNSDGDAYVITPSTTPGGATNGLRISTAGAVTIPGTLGVTGVATFTAAPVFSSPNASEFLLLDGSKALTSVAGTGSGSVVRATSPTLVTPTLGVASATSIALGGNEAFTYDEGTFTLTGTGFTSSPTGTARYTRVGSMVVLYIPAIQAVSNSSSLTYTGLPASIRPARLQTVCSEAVSNNTTELLGGFIEVGTDGTLTVMSRVSATLAGAAWTSSGSKGISGLTITYSLL